MSIDAILGIAVANGIICALYSWLANGSMKSLVKDIRKGDLISAQIGAIVLALIHFGAAYCIYSWIDMNLEAKKYNDSKIKLIVLNIDGVLNHEKSNFYFPPGNEKGVPLDKGCIDALNYITSTTDAKILISSPWKEVKPLPILQFELRNAGVYGDIIGTTPNIPDADRGLELSVWLKNNSDIPLKSLVILDTVKLKGYEGFTVKTSKDTNGLDHSWSRAGTYFNSYTTAAEKLKQELSTVEYKKLKDKRTTSCKSTIKREMPFGESILLTKPSAL